MLILVGFIASFLCIVGLILLVQKQGMVLFACLYMLMSFFFVAYYLFTGGMFDVLFFLDSFPDSITTAWKVLGPFFSLLIVLFFIGLGVVCYLFFRMLPQYLESVCKQYPKWALVTWILTLFAFSLLLPTTHGAVVNQLSRISHRAVALSVSDPFIPNNNHTLPQDATENVFILQLESANALALSGRFAPDNVEIGKTYYPQLESIMKSGVFFPSFWANAIQTNRALETMLCGIVANVKRSFSYHPDALRTKCLPEILRSAGYRTIAFRSDDLSFANMGEFMKTIGFDEVHYDDIMSSEDPHYEWGYDDCTFYKRIFPFLKQHYPESEKLFIYIEVSSHHYPFESQEKYADIHAFPQPVSFYERYINSFLEQDHCLKTFYEQYEKDYGEQSHLFISPDTSLPVGMHGNTTNESNAYNDNFLTFLGYVPPAADRNSFRVGNVVNRIFSQTDLLPTIIDLLKGRPKENSFAFELWSNASCQTSTLGPNHCPYEDCHVLTQPYNGGQVAVVRGTQKYVYSLEQKTLDFFDIKRDFFELNPIRISENMRYGDFRRRYFCKRYQ